MKYLGGLRVMMLVVVYVLVGRLEISTARLQDEAVVGGNRATAYTPEVSPMLEGSFAAETGQLKLSFESLEAVDEVGCEMGYTRKGNVEEMVMGRKAVKGSALKWQEVLGTCSGDECILHEVVSEIEVQCRLESEGEVVDRLSLMVD